MVGGKPGLVLAHVREQRAPVDVADRVQPAAVDALGAQLVVDLDLLPGFEPNGLEPDVGRGRPPPDGDEQLVAGDHATVVEGDVTGPSSPSRAAR